MPITRPASSVTTRGLRVRRAKMRALPIGLATAVLVANAIFAEEPPGPTAPEPPLDRRAVCALLPLSGPHEALGRQALNAIREVLEGRSIRVVPLDVSGGDIGAPVARAHAECAIGIGGIGDHEARRLAEAAEAQAWTVLILGRDPDDRIRSHAIWVGVPRMEVLETLARHCVAERARNTATILVPDTPYGQKVRVAFRRAFEEAGGRVALEQVAPVGEDPARTARTFAAARMEAVPASPCAAEVLFLGFDLETARKVIPRLEFEGVPTRHTEGACLEVLVAGTELWNDPVRVSRLADDLNGAVFAAPERSGLPPIASDAAVAASLAAAWLESATGGEPAPVERAEGLVVQNSGQDLTVRGGRLTGRTIRIFEIRDGGITPWPGRPPAEK